jgi:transcriptional regulator with XRE-family HTH domain
MLAERAEISITFLRNIERGIKHPAAETLAAIATSLEVEVFELYRHDHSPAERRRLFERFKTDITQNLLKTLEAVYEAYED